MRAAVCREYGPPKVLAVEDVPAPHVGADQVRVNVNAAAVNFPDVLLVADQYQLRAPTPFVPGSEFAGVVERTGDGVATVEPGDRVFGTTFVGAFAEQVTVAAGSLTATPDGVDDASAAAFGVAHRTAYHVLRSVAAVQPGDHVIVLGAGGGVGLATVQLASVLGATVTAVASSPAKLAAAAANGATHLVDRRAGGELRAALKNVLPDGADVVIDPVGGDLAEPALRTLRYGGRFVTVGYASGTIPRIPLNLLLLKGVRVVGFQFATFAQHEPDAMRANEAELLELFRAGVARPHIGARFELDDVVEALEHVAGGAAVGKVVLIT
jgi:NADPH2:quinone reductase